MLSEALREYHRSSPMREGVLCWYPFRLGAKVLDLSSGVLSGLLENRCGTVKNVADEDESFDYIVVIDPEDFSIESLEGLKAKLNPHGVLLFAYENPFALRYWSGKGCSTTGMPYDSFFGWGACVSKAELSSRLKRAGFEGQKWYYPLTDHWFTREVYSENYLPDEYLNQRFVPYIENDIALQFDETLLYREVIRGGAFEFMCGAYLVEARACAQDEPCVVNYAAVTAYREPAKRFATTVRADGKVLKVPLHPEGKVSVMNILQNHEELAGLGVNILPVKLEGESLAMPRLSMPTLWDYWVKKLTDGNFDENEIFNQFDRIRAYILKAAKTGKCFWELVPANCFYDLEKDELIFFDQECYWGGVSPDVAIVRAILSLKYSPAFALHPHTEDWIERLKERYDLVEDWYELFKLADERTREEAFGDGARLLEKMTAHALECIWGNMQERIVDRNLARHRYSRYYPSAKRLNDLGFKRPAIYGFGIRGKLLRHVLYDNDIEIAVIFDQSLEQSESIEDLLSENDADVVIISIYESVEIEADLRNRLSVPVYTLEELIDGRA